MSTAEMGDTMSADRPSLLDFANKEAFGCDDYEHRGERLEEYTVTQDDALYVVWEKTKRLTDRILEGKSVAVALGDIKTKPHEEQELKNLTLKENHHWQLWKNLKGELPQMQWHADREEQQQQQEQQRVDQEGDQHTQGKRKSSSRGAGQVEHRRRVKKRNGDEASPVTQLEVEALCQIYRLSPEMKARVIEADVRYFRRMYAPLRPLLSAMTKTLQSRSEAKQAAASKKTEEELRLTEMQSTQKAIYLAEKQAKWIYEETASAYAQIQEQMSIMRGRVSALGGQLDDEEEEEDDMDAVSSSAASPVSSRGEDVQDQVEQDVTLVEQKEATEVIADVVMEKEQPHPPPSSPPKHISLKQASHHRNDPYSDQTIRSEEVADEATEIPQAIIRAVEDQQSAAAYQDSQAAVYDEEYHDQQWTHLYDESVMNQPQPEPFLTRGQTEAEGESIDTRIESEGDDTPWESMLPTKRGARIEQVEEQKVDPRGDVDQEGYHEQGKSAADYGSPISSPASVHQPAPQVENSSSTFWARYGLPPIATTRPTRPSALPQSASLNEAAGQGASHLTSSTPHASQSSQSSHEGVQFGSSASRSFFAQ